MLSYQLRHLGWLLLLLALQTLVFGHIHLMGYATPMIYVLFAAGMRLGIGRAEALLWCFAMGLAVDIFALTPGLAVASMTVLGLIQPPLFELLLPKDAVENCTPRFGVLTDWHYIEYLFILTFIHNLVFFSIEACTLAHWHDSLMRLLASTALTLIIIIPMEKLRE